MSDQPVSAQPLNPDDAQTGLVAGIPGPSGSGEQSDAGADPAAGAEEQTR